MRRQLHVRALLVIATAALCVSSPVSAQSRNQRKAEAAAESSKPRSVAGGSTFTLPMPYEKTYESVLNFLKRQEQTIDQASKDTGQIITGMIISGGYSQTGSRIVVTLIEEDDNSTTVRVAVTEQKRKKLLQTEPWSDPKVNAQKSAAIAEQIKNGVTGTPKNEAFLP